MGRRRGRVLMRLLTELEISMAEPQLLIRLRQRNYYCGAGFCYGSLREQRRGLTEPPSAILSPPN
jgi:hypothetical protein